MDFLILFVAAVINCKCAGTSVSHMVVWWCCVKVVGKVGVMLQLDAGKKAKTQKSESFLLRTKMLTALNFSGISEEGAC